MIELKNVTKRYESLTAVDDVFFSVKSGECFVLLGPNGAGKTTIFKMLLDFARPTSGSLLRLESLQFMSKLEKSKNRFTRITSDRI